LLVFPTNNQQLTTTFYERFLFARAFAFGRDLFAAIFLLPRFAALARAVFLRVFFAGPASARLVRFATFAALVAVRPVAFAADRAAVIVLSTASPATRRAAATEVMPVFSAARSASAPAPCTPAEIPRPTKLAPVSIMLPTASAAC
jgi:hypothetical protein